jgi:hypothetical protein
MRADATMTAGEDADRQGTSAGGDDKWLARADADGQGTRAGATTTSGEDADGKRTRAGAAANNDGITRGIIIKLGTFYFLLGEVSFCSPLAEEFLENIPE